MKKIKLLLFMIIFFVFSPPLLWAYKSPGNYDGYVNDFADILSQETENNLEKLIQAHELKKGNEIAIVTINSLGEDTIENFANHLFNDWEIGKSHHDNGILFLLALEEREMRIEVGYGCEPYLTDLEAKNIQENYIKPHFKENNFSLGITTGINQIVQELESTPQTYQEVSKTSNEFSFLNFIIILLFLFFIIFILVLIAKKSGANDQPSHKLNSSPSSSHSHTHSPPPSSSNSSSNSTSSSSFGGFGGGKSGGGGASSSW